MNCHYHPQKVLNSFCQSSTCHLPLCEDCLQRHSEEHIYFHSFPDIISLENCMNSTLRAIDLIQEGLLDCLSQCNEQMNNDHHNILESLNHEENKVLSIIRKFFESIRKELEFNIEMKNTLLEKEISHFLTKAKSRSKKLDSLRIQLLHKETSIKYLIKSKMRSFETVYMKDVVAFKEYISKLKQGVPKLTVNESILQSMNDQMNTVVQDANNVLKNLITASTRNKNEFENSLEISQGEEEKTPNSLNQSPKKKEVMLNSPEKSKTIFPQTIFSPQKNYIQTKIQSPKIQSPRSRSLERKLIGGMTIVPIKKQQQVNPQIYPISNPIQRVFMPISTSTVNFEFNPVNHITVSRKKDGISRVENRL